MPNRRICPVCHCDVFDLERSHTQIDIERDIRLSFVARRLGRLPRGSEAMDLTTFAHGDSARILACQRCGMLMREEDSPVRYEQDQYDFDLMNHLYPRALESYRSKESRYRGMLADKATVVEVGCFAGAFLQTAEEWGWRATGLDIGDATSAFARVQGGTVKRLALDDYSPRLGRLDGIFIWNCFEQMDDPGAVLRRSHRLLDRHGVVVLRVPNAEFYRHERRSIRTSRRALNGLGYNNLLGFPYLYGYTRTTLDLLLQANGFDTIASYRGSVLPLPYPDLTARIEQESHRAIESGDPWIEVAARRRTC